MFILILFLITGSGCIRNHAEHSCVCLQIHVQPEQPGNPSIYNVDMLGNDGISTSQIEQ